MARILFVCLHNAGRSQMSEALFLREARGRHEARSAGTTPGDHVHDFVVAVMREGKIIQEAAPKEIYAAPSTALVAPTLLS